MDMLNKGKRIHLIVNPMAGQGRAKRAAARALEEFKRAGCNAAVTFTEHRGHGTVMAREAALKGCEVIVAVGGDGTISEVINGIVGTEAVLGVIPCGTANDFAKELQLPSDMPSAIGTIIAGATRCIDLGRINTGTYFMDMAGIGFDAAVVKNLNHKLKLWLRDSAYVVSAIKTLVRYETPLLTIKADDRLHEGSFAVIGNTRYYGGILSITAKAVADDGYLDICIFHGAKKRTLYKYLVGVITRTHLSFRDVTYLRAKKITVTSDKRSFIQMDGDLAGELPATFEVVPEALDVIVPGDRKMPMLERKREAQHA